MNVTEKNGKKVISLEGEINAKTGLDYKNGIKALFPSSNAFVISFKNVVYLNSSGLREIIDLLKQATKEKKELRLTEMAKDIREMFAFTGLDKVFKICNTMNEALA
ncbi:MAG: STAS domain-containing protein [Deferribacteraceae bacterium]|jgi:anti-sigma B factor antagonist|nr:STAS domain-containing protein [Deferribacteraceae bacterium]